MKRALVVLGTVALMCAPIGVARAGGGFCHRETTTIGSGGGIAYGDFCVQPNVLQVRVGQEVVWSNKDQIEHTVTSGSGGWALETLQPGQNFTHTFTKAGVYPFYCQLHPNMGGVVLVGLGKTITGLISDPPASAAGATTSSSSSAGWLALASSLGLVVGVAAVTFRRRLGAAPRKATEA